MASQPRPADTFATRAAKQKSPQLGNISWHLPVSVYVGPVVLMGSMHTCSVICEPKGGCVTGEAAAGRGVSRDTRRHHRGGKQNCGVCQSVTPLTHSSPSLTSHTSTYTSIYSKGSVFFIDHCNFNCMCK